MGSITETVAADAGGFVAAMEECAAAIGAAAAKWDEFAGKIGSGDIGAGMSGGFGKIGEQADAAAASVEAAVKKINASLASAGEGGAAGFGALGDEAKGASGGLDAFAASASAAAKEASALRDVAAENADALSASARAAARNAKANDAIAASSKPAADGIKLTGDASAEAAAAQAEQVKVQRDLLRAQADGRKGAGAALGEDAAAVEAGKTRSATKKAASDSEGFGKAAKMALLGVGVAAAYGIDKAMKFQSQMLLLNTQAGVSLPKVKQMSKGVLEISTTTGQSLSDVAESAYHVASNMASMGSTVPNMLNAVKTAAKGAAVGHANMVDVTNALTASIASGIPGVKNYSSAMGMLNATVGSGDMSMQDLSEAFGTGMVASVKGYGLSLKDVGAGLAVFGDNNIRGAKAGTDMRMAVQSLAVPAASAKKELASLGLTQNSLAKDMESGGLLKALDDLNGKFKEHGISAKNEGQVITDLFGKKAGVGLSLLMEQMDRLKSKYPAITAGASDFNAAWAKTQESPAQKWAELKTGAEASVTSFGTELLPAFTKAAGFADKILADINGSKSGWKDIAVGAGGLAALFTGKKLVSGVESAFKTGEAGLRGIGKVADYLKIPGLGKLANIGQDAGATSAASGLSAVGPAADSAAAALGRLGAVAGEEGLAGGTGGLGAGSARIAEEEAAGSAGLGNALRTGGGALLAGGLVAALAIPLSQQLDKYTQSKLGNTQASGWAQVGSGALAGGAVGATAGSVIPGLGTAAGGIAGALIGGVTTALANRKVWNDIAHGAMPATGPAYADQQQPWQRRQQDMPGMPLPVPGSAHQAQPPTFLHHLVNTYDSNRRAISHLSDTIRGFTSGSFDSSRHMAASIGHDVASFFGFGGGPARPAPAPRVPQWTSVLGGMGSQAHVVTPAAHAGAPDLFSAAGIAGAVKAIKIPAPDLSALNGAKGKISADLNAITTAKLKPIKIPPPDVSALGSAKGKISSDMTSITTAISGAMKPAKMPAPNLSALHGAVGAASADGAAISAGLAAGIAAGAGAAVAAARSVAGQVSAAMAGALAIKSPSKVTEKIGKETDAGLIAGLEGGKSAVADAARAVAKSAVAPFKDAAITDTIKKLTRDLASSFKKGDISKGEDSWLARALKTDNANLLALAKRRAGIEASIKAADSYASGVTSSTNQATGVMAASSALSANGDTTGFASGDLVTQMQTQLQQVTQFNSEIGKLKKEGLNTTSLGQVIQAGVTSGLPVAQGIDQGGASAVSQINKLQKQLSAASRQLGVTSANAMYESGGQISKGLAAGLKTELAGVSTAIKQMATAIVKTVKTELKIHSPSGVFADLGMELPRGLALGIDAGGAIAESAASRLAHRAASGYGSGGGVRASRPAGYGGQGGSYGGGSTTTVHYSSTVHVHVAGNVSATEDLQKSLQAGLLRQSRINLSTGLRLPGHNI